MNWHLLDNELYLVLHVASSLLVVSDPPFVVSTIDLPAFDGVRPYTGDAKESQ